MKAKLFICILCAAVSSFAIAASDPLLDALKLLAQTKTDGCGICAEKEAKKAVGILNKNFRPGMKVSVTGDTRFKVTGICDNNEFILTSVPGGTVVKQDDGTESVLPVVTYRIHTDNDHLAGVDRKDFTAAAQSRPFMKSKSKASWSGEGEIELIRFAYGDGDCFMYFPKSNKIQFQCRVISVKSLKSK
jgi:hypothetical protein